MRENIYRGCLSGNVLKVLACIFMFIDHIGMILLPDVVVLRVVGRLAMPLFAFMFAEGCFYTRRRWRRFALILGLGLVTSAVTVFLLFAIGLLAVALLSGTIQLFSLLAMVLLVFYSGERGKYRMKALFYVFYPAHLALLGGIYLILHPTFLATLF